MILKALYDLAHAEHLVDDPDYVLAEVAYFLSLGPDGSNPKLLSLATERQEGKRAVLDLPKILVPRELSRQGTKAPAFFLTDKASFLFGLDPGKDDPEEIVRFREEALRFRDRVEAAQSGLPQGTLEREAVEALLAFLKSSEAARHGLIRAAYDSTLSAREKQFLVSKPIYVVFAPEGQTPIHLLPAIQTLWRGLRAQERARGPVARCLVTGTRGPKADRHTYLKGVPGGQSSGGPLVTFNKAAFWSYGLSGNNNAPIGQEAAESYAAGLNRLLDNKPRANDGRQLQRQNLLLSADTIALFWSREQTDLSWLLTLADSPDSVREMLRAPHAGKRSVLEDPAAFFTLVLSGAQSRTIVRSFLATQTQDVARSIDLYLEHASVVRPFRAAAGTYPLRDLLRSLAALGDIERLAPDLGTQVYLAAISGRPLPRAVLEAAIRRTRADGPGSSRPDSTEAHQRLLAFAARCSLIRVSLVRQRTFKEEPTVSLDSKNQQPAYLLGRVLAIVDAIQRDALGPRVNATLVDRYYGSASSTPAAVFPTLLRHSQHHLSKLRKEKAGLAVVRERLLQEAAGGLQVFPKTMNLEAQGLFALGFHHQRQALFEKKAPETITN